MPSSFLSVLLWLVSALIRLLLVNAVSHSTALLGVSILENNIPSLTCRRLAHGPTHNASVSRYNCYFYYVLGPVVKDLVCVIPCPFTFRRCQLS